MRTVLRWSIAIALLAGLMLPPEVASAQTVRDGTITVIQPKPVLRRNRLELVPRVSWTIGEPFVEQLGVGGSLNYNVSERFSFGGTFEWFDFGPGVGGTTRRYNDVVAATRAVPEYVLLDYYAGADFTFVPAYGKFVLFNSSIVYYDLFVTLGGGVVHNGVDLRPAGVLAVGARTYFNRWLGMTVEFRDRMSVQELPSRQVLWHTASVMLGFNILMPFNFRYRYDEGGEQ